MRRGPDARVVHPVTDCGDESDPIEGQQAKGRAFGGERPVRVIDRDAIRVGTTTSGCPSWGV